MAYNVVVSTSITWTPPFAPSNSGASTFSITASYNAQNVGNVDIPASTPPGTDFTVPFGTVDKAKVIALKNSGSKELELKINGAMASTFNIPAGAGVIYESSTEQATSGWTSATVTTTDTHTTIDPLQFWIFGD